MAEIVYKITSGLNLTFSVEVLDPGAPYGASGFGSEADAEAWVATKKRRALVGQTWIRRADRKKV
jgi:hypothetical protein